MTKEQIKQKFKETYHDFMRGDTPLSPYYDIWCYAIEIVTAEMQEGLDKIKETCELSLECKQSVFDKQIKDLQEENSRLAQHIVELQKEKGKLTDRCVNLEKKLEESEHNKKTVAYLSDCISDMQDKQLKLAKEHIRTLISCLIDWVQDGDKDYCYIADAEQFLKEGEKDG